MNRKIKALLIKRGIKQKDIAESYKRDGQSVSRGLVSGVINGHSESKPLKKHIAKMVGWEYERLWGKAA